MPTRTGVLMLAASVAAFGSHAAISQGIDRDTTIVATAHIKSVSGGDESVPVRIAVDHFSTEQDRESLLAALRKGGTTAARDLLAGRDRIGSVHVGSIDTPIKYVSERTTADGLLIIAVTGSPITFLDAHLPGAPSTAGYEVGFALLEVMTNGPGHGELVLAAKLEVDAQGAIVTDEYGPEVVRLVDVRRKK